MAIPSTYRNLLKSITIIGGAQVIKIGISIVQVNILEVLLDLRSRVGLAGTYQSRIGIVGDIFGMGVVISGVSQVAEDSATKDQIEDSIFIRLLPSFQMPTLGLFLCP